MGRNGVFSYRWKWKPKKSVCSCAFLWKFLFLISFLVYVPLLFLASGRLQCRDSPATAIQTTTNIVSKPYTYQGDLRKLETSWNVLTFGSKPSPNRLKIAVFIKWWSRKDRAGGLEHHAQTLYRALTKRGHQVHVFTSISNNPTEIVENDKSMQFHFSNNSDPTNMFVNKEEAWLEFQNIKQILNGFDIIHTESVCLPPKYALGLNNVVATWHGTGYEVIHSYIVQDLSRDPNQARSHDLDQALKEQVEKVIHEINFFPSYKHHVAISDYLGDVLRTVYMLPAENISIIVNGLDEGQFQPNPSKGREFRETHGVATDAKLVLGMAGRLVKDKGHPLVFRVLREMFLDNQNKNIFVVIVGSGPWASRYAELGPNVKVLGSLISDQLGDFYNSLDIFLSPTLRAQGLDLTLVEAMMCGKPLLATHFSSITKSVIVSEEFGYTFSPTFKSLKNGLERVLEDGKEVLEKKGRACRRRASLLFTAQKMAAAYERLFLCIAKGPKDNINFCSYPLDFD